MDTQSTSHSSFTRSHWMDEEEEEEPGIKPPTFWFVDDPLCLLGHRQPPTTLPSNSWKWKYKHTNFSLCCNTITKWGVSTNGHVIKVGVGGWGGTCVINSLTLTGSGVNFPVVRSSSALKGRTPASRITKETADEGIKKEFSPRVKLLFKEQYSLSLLAGSRHREISSRKKIQVKRGRKAPNPPEPPYSCQYQISIE